jgi:asparagine synthase (glutamine-hydrolysing)
MCGIAGFYGQLEPELLARMSTAISHRGPDGNGILHLPKEGVGLAHRRLAIIDLSPTGAQPMWDDSRRLCIVFNGEIYNFRELRTELEASNFTFRGHSDTEVLLSLYMRDGVGCLEHLNGIFAFAIWDMEKCELFLARDGLGVKPLYYSETPKGFLFASELKALLEEPSVGREIDPIAVAQYLTYLWCPSPRTMLKGTHKLEPGYAMIVRNAHIERQWCFYDLPVDLDQPVVTEECALQAVHRTLGDAVRRQMVADVPVGAFLSGGLDSSSIVSFARQHTNQRLQCFTIGFRGDGAHQEGMAEDLPYARKVATHLGVDLHTVTVGPEMADCLPEMIRHLDEPQADPAPLNALFICRLAREQGIKVLLSGAGGDDLFTGYRRHFALQQERYWKWLPQIVRQGLGRLAGNLRTMTPLSRRLRKAFENAGLSSEERIVSYFFWVDPAVVRELLVPDLQQVVTDEAVVNPLFEAKAKLQPSATPLERMLYLEAKFFLADHNLNYTDKMGMATGVEVRVPFLDPDVINLAASLPDDFRQRGREGKWILKRAMERDLPYDVIYRPKTGFGVPLRRWLRYELRELVDEMLSPSVIQARGLFNVAAVQRLVEKDRAGITDAAYTIFGIVCIELWCQIFIDRRHP